MSWPWGTLGLARASNQKKKRGWQRLDQNKITDCREARDNNGFVPSFYNRFLHEGLNIFQPYPAHLKVRPFNLNVLVHVSATGKSFDEKTYKPNPLSLKTTQKKYKTQC